MSRFIDWFHEGKGGWWQWMLAIKGEVVRIRILTTEINSSGVMEIWKDYLWVERVWDQITLRNKHCWIIGIS